MIGVLITIKELYRILSVFFFKVVVVVVVVDGLSAKITQFPRRDGLLLEDIADRGIGESN